MRILGLRIGRSRSGGKKKKKTATRMERIASAALLEAAKQDHKVLLEIMNKYGKIREYDKSESEIQSLEDQIYQKAVQNMLKDGNRELDDWIDEIIDRVMGLNSVPGRRRYEERPFEGVTPGGHNSTPNTVRQRRGMQGSLKTSSNSSVFIRTLAMLAVLDETVNQQTKKQKIRGSLEE